MIFKYRSILLVYFVSRGILNPDSILNAVIIQANLERKSQDRIKNMYSQYLKTGIKLNEALNENSIQLVYKT